MSGHAPPCQIALDQSVASDRLWPTTSVPPLARDLPFASKPTTAKDSSLGVRRKIGHGHNRLFAKGSMLASHLSMDLRSVTRRIQSEGLV
jgi:hypothetical protein